MNIKYNSKFFFYIYFRLSRQNEIKFLLNFHLKKKIIKTTHSTRETRINKINSKTKKKKKKERKGQFVES